MKFPLNYLQSIHNLFLHCYLGNDLLLGLLPFSISFFLICSPVLVPSVVHVCTYAQGKFIGLLGKSLTLQFIVAGFLQFLLRRSLPVTGKWKPAGCSGKTRFSSFREYLVVQNTVACEVSLMTGEVLYELVLSNLTNLLLCTVVFNAFTLHGFSSSSLSVFPSTFHDRSYQ